MIVGQGHFHFKQKSQTLVAHRHTLLSLWCLKTSGQPIIDSLRTHIKNILVRTAVKERGHLQHLNLLSHKLDD